MRGVLGPGVAPVWPMPGSRPARLYLVRATSYPRRMTTPAESAPREPTYVALERPRRSPLLVISVLLLGVILGASCVTCARGSFDLQGDQVYGTGEDRVGVVELEGAIMEVEALVRTIRRFARRDDLDGLVLRIESPGGAVAPSQEVFEALRYASEKMPVVASMGTVAASGGFWAALGADWIVAEPGTITGSIGVITQTPDLRGLADKIDFRLRTFKSGPVKDLGNPLRELTERDREVFNALIDDIYEQFVEVTMERRSLSEEAVRRLADGQVLSGQRAQAEGLVDELGGLHHAARRAVVMHEQRTGELEVGTSTSVEDRPDPALVYPKPGAPRILELLAETTGEAIGRAWASAWGAGWTDVPVMAR